MKNVIKRILRLFFPELRILYPASEYEVLHRSKLTYSNDFLWTYNNADFLRDPKFLNAYSWCKKIDKERLLHNYDIQWRIHTLCWAASQVKDIPGDFVDCGVHSGMCARAVIDYVDFQTLNKRYHLFDTFTGLDERFSSQSEMERGKLMGYSDKAELYEEVRSTFAEFDVDIVKGSIPDSLSRFSGDTISYLSIDMNCVLPEIEALEYFWDKLSPGGIVILDDYGYPGHQAQKEAHDEFARSKQATILSLPTCQGLIIKN